MEILFKGGEVHQSDVGEYLDLGRGSSKCPPQVLCLVRWQVAIVQDMDLFWTGGLVRHSVSHA